jgi:L,D-peptidoglycan transpeptidase YkuD (ErfK/YbiS/YcfS/YnhG family)
VALLAPIVFALGLTMGTACSGSSGDSGGPAGVRTTQESSSISAPSSAARPPAPSTTTSRPTHPRSAHPRSTHPTGMRLPLGFDTGRAEQVLTVVAASTSSTRGLVQAWRKVASGWKKVGPSVPAWLGSEGLSRHPSESKNATPIGSFTLTRAFGHDPNPGTALKYTHTTPADWWISESGPLYNTRQRCSSGCAFRQGDPNEHLYFVTPYYDYAVVIDYNTRNSPGGVRQGAGSAFFLHVAVGQPTAGCVAIPKDQLVRILRWLEPSRSPRILIGTSP